MVLKQSTKQGPFISIVRYPGRPVILGMELYKPELPNPSESQNTPQNTSRTPSRNQKNTKKYEKYTKIGVFVIFFVFFLVFWFREKIRGVFWTSEGVLYFVGGAGTRNFPDHSRAFAAEIWLVLSIRTLI